MRLTKSEHQHNQLKTLITIITIIAVSGFGHADGPKPKFKSYVEMQAERVAKADAVSARYAAERKIAEERTRRESESHSVKNRA
jgi:hypothetical protein